ncbi:MAG: hypothetical protein JWP88_1751 [Flaviaesturariibacter sp.]|nr:hypothetical protein [Flaviaesturariibacter sp.]
MKLFGEKWKSWELWPFWMRYVNITPTWLGYCARAGSLWFFTPSNPTLTFGGFEGESKREMYEQLPPGSFPKTSYIQPGIPFREVSRQLQEAGFTYPFIVKPDVGMAGILFRKIEKEAQLEAYHDAMPVDYIIQDLVTYPIEYSVFYYRFPGQQKGVITGFLQKEPMNVIGNGESTLGALMQVHPKARFRLAELEAWHKDKLDTVLPKGQKYFLTHAANLNRGGNFINLHHEIDEPLHKVFDDLNLYSKDFYYGRYDLKAASLEDLKAGQNFTLLEYNGSGAEPNHVYNSGYSLREAHAEILKHWDALYKISMYNHKKGVPFWSLQKGLNFMKASTKHFKKLQELDARI